MAAAEEAHTQIAEILVQANAHVNCKDNSVRVADESIVVHETICVA